MSNSKEELSVLMDITQQHANKEDVLAMQKREEGVFFMMHILGQGEGEKMWYKNVHNALVKIWKKEFYKYSNDPQQNHTTSTTWRNSLIRIKDLDSNMVDTKIKT